MMVEGEYSAVGILLGHPNEARVGERNGNRAVTSKQSGDAREFNRQTKRSRHDAAGQELHERIDASIDALQQETRFGNCRFASEKGRAKLPELLVRPLVMALQPVQESRPEGGTYFLDIRVGRG